MTVYLLHFERPIGNPANPRGQAQHYLGFTDNLEQRIEQHRKGWSGSAIVRAFHDQGIPFVVARTWDAGRDQERYFKQHGKHASRLCPVCRAATPPENGGARREKEHEH